MRPSPARRRRHFAPADSLEPRRLLAAFPTDFEQYELELLNRARANPTAEVTRLSGRTWGDDPSDTPGTSFPQPQTPSLNEGLPAGTISTAAKQPLAFNTNLIQAARDYSQTLIDNDAFTHTFGGTTSSGRMTSNGYSFSPAPAGSGENLAVTASSGSHTISTSIAEQHHNNLFVDNDVVGRGHRTNMMNANWREAGIGLAQGGGYTLFGSPLNAVITTQDFAFTTSNPFLTGVAYTDAVADDDFYTPGEGLNGVTVSARRTSDGMTFNTTTFSSGGYSLRLAAGTYDLTASGGALPSPVTSNGVVIGTQNVKRDFLPGTPAPQVTLTDILNGKGTLVLDPPAGSSFDDFMVAETSGDMVLVRYARAVYNGDGSFNELATRGASPTFPLEVRILRPLSEVREVKISGGTGKDRLLISSALTIPGAALGGVGDDTLVGGNGNDVLVGEDGADTLDGGGGHDRLDGQGAADVLAGGSGDDVLIGGETGSPTAGQRFADLFVGGPGTDLADYSNRSGAVTVTLDQQANDGATGENDFVGPENDVEDLSGSAGNDRLVGNAAVNRLFGNGGNDTLVGAAGDLLTGGDGDDRDDAGNPIP